MDTPELKIQDDSPLFDKTGLNFIEFNSEFSKIRYFTLMVVQKAPFIIKEINLLEQQISELIKNAVKHGNKSDEQKKIRVWYSFTEEDARIIVEDEGKGFGQIAEWNAFNKERQRIIAEGSSEMLTKYVAWHGQDSDENDGGNALFGALEYWNGGIVYNSRRNAVATRRMFQHDSFGNRKD